MTCAIAGEVPVGIVGACADDILEGGGVCLDREGTDAATGGQVDATACGGLGGRVSWDEAQAAATTGPYSSILGTFSSTSPPFDS